jgi:hypothetical protein
MQEQWAVAPEDGPDFHSLASGRFQPSSRTFQKGQ